jgi:hypothetical protein
VKIKEGYSLARCCKPCEADTIEGYYSHNMVMIVHKRGCANLGKVDSERIVSLEWQEILDSPDFEPDADYRQLESLDWRVLRHHEHMGVDYSHVVARALHVAKDEIFACHRKLRGMKLLARVKPLIMQYRKGIVDNKWIKHRNHTYYELTEKGRRYLEYHEKSKEK